ncbi:MAG: IS4 family transposase [Bacteroidetes bacterium]|nr:MAG: IS4 family transposase [Bacteroidota bacterium]
MACKKYHAKLFKELSKLLTLSKFYEPYCFDKKHFTRKRKLSFQIVALLTLRLLKSSVKTELKSFYSTVFKIDEVVNWVSDVAFCKARQKIRHQFFIDMYKFIVRFFYSNVGGKRWFHFRLLAVDGSALNLPSSKELLERYCCHHTNSIGTKIPVARVSFLCDVLNYFTIDAQIESFKVGEQKMFESHLKYIGKGDLLTGDANYGYFRILIAIMKRKAEFCIRMSQSTNFIQRFLASGKKDIVTEWMPSAITIKNCKGHGVDFTPFKVRLVRIDLSNGETEVLALSLLDQDKYGYDCIKELYDKRWGVEEEIKKFMQRLMIEFFSSKKENGVLQDFYANIFMLNLVSFLTQPVAQQVYTSSSHCKYRRQVNWTAALGDVRQRVVLLFLRSIDKIDSIIKSFWESFKMNTEAIKPGRKFLRDKRKKGARLKAFMPYKPAW